MVARTAKNGRSAADGNNERIARTGSTATT
jgi:hypothetical protein